MSRDDLVPDVKRGQRKEQWVEVRTLPGVRPKFRQSSIERAEPRLEHSSTPPMYPVLARLYSRLPVLSSSVRGQSSTYLTSSCLHHLQTARATLIAQQVPVDRFCQLTFAVFARLGQCSQRDNSRLPCNRTGHFFPYWQ